MSTTQLKLIRNGLGQVLDLGTVVIYPKKINGSMRFKMTPAVINDIGDLPNGETVLYVLPAHATRPARLTAIENVIVIDLATVNIPQAEVDFLTQARAVHIKE